MALAQRFGGEIIGADSMQIYRGLDVGTAKPLPGEQGGVAHHLVGFLPPEQPFSVADYVAAAGACIAGVTARGALPIVVGGTGLYITSLLDGVRFAPEQPDPALRAALQCRAQAEGPGPLYRELQAVDPAYAATVHPNNLPRVIRALELWHATGRKMSEERRQSRPAQRPYRALCLCLACRDRAVLYRRIDARVDRMLEQGILREAELVYRNRGLYRTAAQAIGYKEFFPYFEGQATVNDCANRLKQASRNYAKRQLTWFRHQDGVQWLYTDEPLFRQQAQALVEGFLAQEPD